MEKTKEISPKKWSWKVFLLSQITIVICTVIVSLITIFVITDYTIQLSKGVTNGAYTFQFVDESVAATTGIFLSNFLLFETFYMSLFVFDPKHLRQTSQFVLDTIVVTITYILSIVLYVFCSPFAVPIQLCALLLAILISDKTALLGLVNMVFILLVNLVLRGVYLSTLIITVIAAVVSSMISAGIMINFAKKHYMRIRFFLYCLIAAVIPIPYIIVLTISMNILDIRLLFNILWGLLSSVVSLVLYFPFVILFEAIFNTTDDFRLDELCRLDHPLLKKLASEAPGTFNHSLVVGNLAESCAMAIGENSRLAKAAAYYHDVGKLKAPIYFIENQSDYNPHDELIPEVSVSMITSHTIFGEILNKQYKLPKEIVQISLEHHGTSPVGYFYQKALLLTEGVADKGRFSYAGPKPSTKVSAIIMIADTVEAATRAYMPPTKEEFVTKINSLVDEKLKLGQFDECPITMLDLTIIKNTIIDVLPSIHHSRVQYGDKLVKKELGDKIDNKEEEKTTKESEEKND